MWSVTAVAHTTILKKPTKKHETKAGAESGVDVLRGTKQKVRTPYAAQRAMNPTCTGHGVSPNIDVV